ncbi:MAG: DNA polymerase III subunit delta [bacterium]
MKEGVLNLDRNIIITGNDLYRIESLINDYKTLAKKNNYEIVTVDAEKLNIEEVTEIIYTSPMFSCRRLVIIKGVDRMSESDADMLITDLKKVNSECIYIIVIETISNELQSIVNDSDIEIIEMNSLKYRQLHTYIKEKYKSVLKIMGDKILTSLIEIYGNDLPMIDSEMKKLSLLLVEGICDKKEIEMLVPQMYIERAIYKMIDDILEGKKDNAVRYIRALDEHGVDVYQILALLENLFVRLMLLKINNIWDEKEASKTIGLPPYIASKYLKYSQRISYDKLKDITNKLIGIDYLMKEGKIVGYQNIFQVAMNIT